MDRMAGALLDAQVDLNPHQIDAALFATSNPLSRGAILADEVGLGKTIEAGLLIAQKWAERKRRILVITPYQFAAGKARDVQSVPWDLVVIDEAHRLRNVYKPENKTARILRDALTLPHKVLLTATPLQNSLLELYALPNSQRQLITLVLRKLLASSTFAIAGALETLIKRLGQTLDEKAATTDLADELDQDYEALNELADESTQMRDAVAVGTTKVSTVAEITAIRAEVGELESFRNLAISITENAKGTALLQALNVAFKNDLPWNPQRIEQRIGRCHRYGQKHDVVVVNFLNRDNDADRRVYQLLAQKFQLFDGVFVASDEVLGAVESGVDFERRIAEIYQTCRHTASLPRVDGAPVQQSLSDDLAPAQQNILDFAAANVVIVPALQHQIDQQRALVITDIESRNLSFFSQETEKLDAWADDLKVGLEREIKELDRQIKDARTKSKGAATLADKLQAQKEQRDLEGQRDRKRRELFNRQDEIQARRDDLIAELETQLRQQITVATLFAVEWEVL
ncbi:MAG: hypothetical protein IPK02_04030 [Candidatus Accumulibacter sp.]|uniref:DEAD/DEAH box helicase n=1 Tax=Candidatus Accumulibacter affinis TaxID=2954384 RepID=A0A935W3M8_9PROT|nr:hypothetical protein [Candidatus Accumulibacter affinis]